MLRKQTDDSVKSQPVINLYQDSALIMADVFSS